VSANQPSHNLIMVASSYLGQRETPGPGFNAWIKNMWMGLPSGRTFWKDYGEDDSKLPWCGAFMALVFKQCGLAFPDHYASSLAWRNLGPQLKEPRYGCLAVRGNRGRGGHVGLVITESTAGNHILLLGGNQSDAVTQQWFNRAGFTYHAIPGVVTQQVQRLPFGQQYSFNFGRDDNEV
jgi:uncharacterized protein (TIGR02594 family)